MTSYTTRLRDVCRRYDKMEMDLDRLAFCRRVHKELASVLIATPGEMDATKALAQLIDAVDNILNLPHEPEQMATGTLAQGGAGT